MTPTIFGVLWCGIGLVPAGAYLWIEHKKLPHERLEFFFAFAFAMAWPLLLAMLICTLPFFLIDEFWWKKE